MGAFTIKDRDAWALALANETDRRIEAEKGREGAHLGRKHAEEMMRMWQEKHAALARRVEELEGLVSEVVRARDLGTLEHWSIAAEVAWLPRARAALARGEGEK